MTHKLKVLSWARKNDLICIATYPWQLFVSFEHRQRIIREISHFRAAKQVPHGSNCGLIRCPISMASKDLTLILGTAGVKEIYCSGFGMKGDLEEYIPLLYRLRQKDPNCRVEYDIGLEIAPRMAHWVNPESNRRPPKDINGFPSERMVLLAKCIDEEKLEKEGLLPGVQAFQYPLCCTAQVMAFGPDVLPLYGSVALRTTETGDRDDGFIKANAYMKTTHQQKAVTHASFEGDFSGKTAGTRFQHCKELVKNLLYEYGIRIETRHLLPPAFGTGSEFYEDAIVELSSQFMRIIDIWVSLDFLLLPTRHIAKYGSMLLDFYSESPLCRRSGFAIKDATKLNEFQRNHVSWVFAQLGISSHKFNGMLVRNYCGDAMLGERPFETLMFWFIQEIVKRDRDEAGWAEILMVQMRFRQEGWPVPRKVGHPNTGTTRIAGYKRGVNERENYLSLMLDLARQGDLDPTDGNPFGSRNSLNLPRTAYLPPHLEGTVNGGAWEGVEPRSPTPPPVRDRWGIVGAVPPTPPRIQETQDEDDDQWALKKLSKDIRRQYRRLRNNPKYKDKNEHAWLDRFYEDHDDIWVNWPDFMWQEQEHHDIPPSGDERWVPLDSAIRVELFQKLDIYFDKKDNIYKLSRHAPGAPLRQPSERLIVNRVIDLTIDKVREDPNQKEFDEEDINFDKHIRRLMSYKLRDKPAKYGCRSVEESIETPQTRGGGGAQARSDGTSGRVRGSSIVMRGGG